MDTVTPTYYHVTPDPSLQKVSCSQAEIMIDWVQFYVRYYKTFSGFNTLKYMHLSTQGVLILTTFKSWLLSSALYILHVIHDNDYHV